MADTDSTPTPDAPPVRKRPKPGERRVQILQALATMLEQPGAERITTKKPPASSPWCCSLARKTPA